MGCASPCSVCLTLRHQHAAPLSELHFTFSSCLNVLIVAASGPGAAGLGRVFSTAPAVASAPATSLFRQQPPEFAALTPPWVAIPPWSGPGGVGAASSQPSGAPHSIPCLYCRS